jgi:uncharacterized protein (DUF488 family)
MATRAKASPAKPTRWPARTVFTVGHSTLPIDRFIGLLATYGVEEVADIRKIPKSRHNPQYWSDALEDELKAASIDYVWMDGLGGRRQHANPDSPNTGWRNKSFRGYADYMQTAAFEEALENLVDVSGRKRTVIMCAEAVPWRCHRSLVADALCVRGIPVADIFSETNCRPHKLTPFAHTDGTRITYPPD